jgi:Beta-glucosidase-related glycosidases
MKKFWWILAILTAWILVGCDPVEPEPEPQPAPQPEEKIVYSLKDISEMTLREKVGQLFNVRAEDLDLTSSYTITAGSTVVTEGFNRYPCGGITLFAANIKNPEQIKALTKYLHGLGNYPLICVDEEGGRVARIANNSNFNVVKYASMSAVGATGDPKKAYEAGDNIGSYLSLYGFDVDLAPVSDVNTNPENVVIGDRAFGSSPQLVADMASQFLLGLQKESVEGCLKHFPGHGDTKADTHYGYAESLKTWDELKDCEMIPFQKGIATGAQMVMTAHVCLPNVTGGSIPSTLSPMILGDILRGRLGFKGVIITDSMGMGAITQQYSPEEAAIVAIEAGVDIVLDPADYVSAFEAVVSAVESGRISMARIDESVSRVLELKKKILRQRGQLLI